ncbi:MAG: ribonuclease HI [Candidatus Sericytochromatia bacterium]
MSTCKECGETITWLRKVDGKPIAVNGQVLGSPKGIWAPYMGNHWQACSKRRKSSAPKKDIPPELMPQQPTATVDGVAVTCRYNGWRHHWEALFQMGNVKSWANGFADTEEAIAWATALIRDYPRPAQIAAMEAQCERFQWMSAAQLDALLAGQAFHPNTAAPKKTTTLPRVTIYTDGSNIGQPGPGGWAALLIDESGRRRELSGPMVSATNNQAELMGVIRGLQVLQRPCEVALWSDSQYVVMGLNGRLARWASNGWRTQAGEVKNRDLWEIVLALIRHHRVTGHWVKGHSGHPENTRVDELARQQSRAEKKRQSEGVTV